MILKAPAKINLHLDVGRRRSDGYHSLKTIFQEISLCDSLSFRVSDKGIRLTVTPRGLPTNRDNLIVRALEMLQAALGVEKGISVHLTKRVPMGAGLGGGSSDAAAALWGGWLLWKAHTKRKPTRVPPLLVSCAKKLGADVAFFLKGGLAKAEGIGERLTSLGSTPRRWIVLVYPRVHVATVAAYRLLDEARKRAQPSKPNGRFNSFEPVIMKRFPRIASARRALVDAGCSGVLMSGSGSTVFGFVRNKSDGQRVVRLLKRRPWDFYLVHTA